MMDFGAEESLLPVDFIGVVNTGLPEGLEVIEAYEPIRKFSEIARIEMIGKLYYDDYAVADIAGKLSERFAAESIVVAKKTKSGLSELDVALYINDVAFSSGDDRETGCAIGCEIINMRATVSAINPSITPDNLISALDGDYDSLKPDFTSFIRMRLLDSENKVIR